MYEVEQYFATRNLTFYFKLNNFDNLVYILNK